LLIKRDFAKALEEVGHLLRVLMQMFRVFQCVGLTYSQLQKKGAEKCIDGLKNFQMKEYCIVIMAILASRDPKGAIKLWEQGLK
jgi:hypothetical protein